MPLTTIEKSVELIKSYKETGDINLRNQIVILYGNLVKCIAVSMRNMYIKYAEVDDIVNEGVILLINAINTFDFDKNVKFETYASLKIRGGIIDFIRKQDFVPRNLRKFAKQLENTYAELYAVLDREPTDEEMASKMELDISKFQKLMSESVGINTISFEEIVFEGDFQMSDNNNGEWTAEKNLLLTEKKKILMQAIDNLKEKERQVISLYYYEKLKYSEIAKVLEVSESRVCQIHSQAVIKLKNSLLDYLR